MLHRGACDNPPNRWVLALYNDKKLARVRRLEAKGCDTPAGVLSTEAPVVVRRACGVLVGEALGCYDHLSYDACGHWCYRGRRRSDERLRVCQPFAYSAKERALGGPDEPHRLKVLVDAAGHRLPSVLARSYTSASALVSVFCNRMIPRIVARP